MVFMQVINIPHRLLLLLLLYYRRRQITQAAKKRLEARPTLTLPKKKSGRVISVVKFYDYSHNVPRIRQFTCGYVT